VSGTNNNLLANSCGCGGGCGCGCDGSCGCGTASANTSTEETIIRLEQAKAEIDRQLVELRK
jgi:hypothetical protein